MLRANDVTVFRSKIELVLLVCFLFMSFDVTFRCENRIWAHTKHIFCMDSMNSRSSDQQRRLQNKELMMLLLISWAIKSDINDVVAAKNIVASVGDAVLGSECLSGGVKLVKDKGLDLLDSYKMDLIFKAKLKRV
ncbi:hypothetical protein L1887_29813 [Cichorium endivia]|nr:hypothetical protein L1887_29813 [Cichorium endivia]